MTNSHRSTEDKAVADITVSDAAPRGKPEAMAQALAAAKIESNREEVAEMKRKEEERMKTEDAEEEVEAVAEVEVEAEPVAEEDEDEAIAEPVSQPVAVAKKPSETKKKSPARKKKPKSQPSASALEVTRSRDILSRPVDPVSEEEWGNLDALMNQFCRIPLLAEFSRPVSLLHPEVSLTTLLFRRLVSTSNHTNNRLPACQHLFKDCQASFGSWSCLPRHSSSTVQKPSGCSFRYVACVRQLRQVPFPPEQQRSCPIIRVDCLAFARILQQLME